MDTTTIEECKAYINKLREEYKENQIKEQEREELISENNIENRDIKGYHGREILELLQNADDAYQKSIDLGNKPSEELCVLISYKNNIFKIENTGTFFDKDGIKAIVQGNNSPKKGKYIGNKGTGFRSVLNWAKDIKIYSGNFNVHFTKDISLKIFDEIKNEPQIKKQLAKKKDLYIPMLEVPENLDSKYNDKTTIEIEIDENKIQDDFSVHKQLEDIDLRILLFLPNISKIHIVTDDKDIVYKREISTDEFCFKNVSLQKEESGNITTEENFFLFEKTIPKALREKDENELKDILLAIAVPQDFSSFKKRNLYTFFPLLDTESPFNCILHASYLLGDQRNTINSGVENKKIIEEQLKFLVKVANKFIQKKMYDTAYKVLVPANFQSIDANWKFSTPFAKFNFENYYLDLLAEQKIFLTVNDKNISINDKPKMFDSDFPDVFTGEKFKNLLKLLSNEKMLLLLETLTNRAKLNIRYKENELLEIINSLSNSWSISQQTEVFIWWNKHYSNSLPNLLKTQYGDWIKFNQDCYLLAGDFDNIEIPSWVKISSLRRDYQQELFLQSEKIQEVKNEKQKQSQDISRVIVQNNIFPTVKFAYRDRSNIISTVNSSVGNNYKNAVEFVQWLWKNYREDENWIPPGMSNDSENKITYHFPCKKNKTVKSSRELFFGTEYGSPLAEKLFGLSDEKFGNFPPVQEFSISEDETENFKSFIKKFGVLDFPAIEKKEIEPIESYKKKYRQFIENFFDYNVYLDLKFQLPFINNLEYILEKLPSFDIVKWIFYDNELNNCLSEKNYPSESATIIYHSSRRSYNQNYNSNIKNYILELFNTSKWIEINGIRYSPREVLRDSKANRKFEEFTPVLSDDLMKVISNHLKCNFVSIQEIFRKFDFCEDITDLPSENFYKILLAIPKINNFDTKASLSKTVYRAIEKLNSYGTYQIFDFSPNKDTFFKYGEILVRHNGQLEFHSAKDSFLPSSKIVNKKKEYIVEKNIRQGDSSVFIKIFGCKEYKDDYTVDKKSILTSPANNEFQTCFTDFRKYAYAYNSINSNIEEASHKLRISLVKKIFITKNDATEEITDEYECVRDTSTNWFITVCDDSFDIREISKCIEIIYDNIANTSGFDSGKFGELFRAKEKADKEFLIKKDFGSLDVIDDDSYQNEIKNNFIATVQKIAPEYPFEEIDIDFDHFDDIENSPRIIALFQKLNIDIEQFKNEGFEYPIDLIPYFKKELKDFIQDTRLQFKNTLFTESKKDPELQNDFIAELDKYEHYDSIIEFENSVNFDIKMKVSEKFGNSRDENIESTKDVAKNEYSKNYEEMNPNCLFEDEISNNPKVQTMIYFHNEGDFKIWIEEMQRKEEQDKLKSSDNPYDKFKDVIPDKFEISYTEPKTLQPDSGNGSLHRGAYSSTGKQKKEKNLKTFGNKGELLIYNFLCKKYGKENVFPHSEAFVEIGILKPGQAVSGDYDISYKDEKGKEYFVEVKTSNSGQIFYMSPDELEFAKNNSDKYKLFFVYDIDSDNPEESKYYELPLCFWENEKYRKKEIIEKIEFNF